MRAHARMQTSTCRGKLRFLLDLALAAGMSSGSPSGMCRSSVKLGVDELGAHRRRACGQPPPLQPDELQSMTVDTHARNAEAFRTKHGVVPPMDHELAGNSAGNLSSSTKNTGSRDRGEVHRSECRTRLEGAIAEERDRDGLAFVDPGCQRPAPQSQRRPTAHNAVGSLHALADIGECASGTPLPLQASPAARVSLSSWRRRRSPWAIARGRDLVLASVIMGVELALQTPTATLPPLHRDARIPESGRR